jgi:hypothetical protein
VVPFGYRVESRRLLVEAATVRLIFERYGALRSLPALQRELRERGILTRRRQLANETLCASNSSMSLAKSASERVSRSTL